MALREIDDDGRVYDVTNLNYRAQFEQTWRLMTADQRAAIEAEINRRLDTLVAAPDPNWGSITNTSIEGSREFRSETVFMPIYLACGQDEDRAGMFFGTVWKKVIIERPERWIGIRTDPTFPQRGVTLEGKTYFLDTNP